MSYPPSGARRLFRLAQRLTRGLAPRPPVVGSRTRPARAPEPTAVRLSGLPLPVRTQQPTVFSVLRERALEDSADFIEPFLNSAMIFGSNAQNQKYAAALVHRSGRTGFCLEFGVFNGKSINFFADKLPEHQFYGFDSFEGLAEDWVGYHLPQGHFSLGGALPKVRENVDLVPGLFHETLPGFVASHDLDDLCFIHVDCDTYPATKTVFEHVGPFLTPGVFILFDELLGYPNWRNGEFKALQEAAEELSFSYTFRSFGDMSALIEIT